MRENLTALIERWHLCDYFTHPLPQIPNLSQYNKSNFINEIPKDANKKMFLSKLILWAIIKNVKQVSVVNYMDLLHMKWCILKNMKNWRFSPLHTLSHKTKDILRTVADMTKIQTTVCRKHRELSMITKSSVLLEKEHLCNYFPNPLPQNSIIFYSMQHMILLIILQISEIYQSFLFSVQLLVLLIKCKHYFMEILCYLTSPWTNPWKYVSKFLTKNTSVLFVLIGEKMI